MSFVCLLRGCHWRVLASPDINLHCQLCERCGAMRYSQPLQP